MFLGRLGPDALAGVSLAFPFVILTQDTAASGMGGGVSSAIARALGAGKRAVADALTLHTFVLALGLAAAFSIVLLLGAPFVFRWMGGHGEILSSALAYANEAFSGAVSIYMHDLPRPVLSSHPKRCSLKFVQEEAGSLPPRLDAGPGRKQWPPTSL